MRPRQSARSRDRTGRSRRTVGAARFAARAEIRRAGIGRAGIGGARRRGVAPAPPPRGRDPRPRRGPEHLGVPLDHRFDRHDRPGIGRVDRERGRRRNRDCHGCAAPARAAEAQAKSEARIGEAPEAVRVRPDHNEHRLPGVVGSGPPADVAAFCRRTHRVGPAAVPATDDTDQRSTCCTRGSGTHNRAPRTAGHCASRADATGKDPAPDDTDDGLHAATASAPASLLRQPVPLTGRELSRR